MDLQIEFSVVTIKCYLNAIIVYLDSTSMPSMNFIASFLLGFFSWYIPYSLSYSNSSCHYYFLSGCPKLQNSLLPQPHACNANSLPKTHLVVQLYSPDLTWIVCDCALRNSAIEV